MTTINPPVRIDITTDPTTPGPVVAKDPAYKAVMTITNANGSSFAAEQLYNAPIEISVGGNYTAGLPKQPYNIKPKNSSGKTVAAAVLGMPASESFRLLAGYDDSLTGLRTAMIHEAMAEGVLDYNCRCRWAELYIDGVAKGLYLLCQRPKNKSAIALAKAPTGGTPGQQGYLLEQDNYTEEGEIYYSTSVYAAHLKQGYPDPEDITPEQQAYVTNFLSEMETAIQAGDLSKIDVPSWAKMFALITATKNWDGYSGSTYFYIPAGSSKMCAGPIWDVTLSLATKMPGMEGVTKLQAPQGWWDDSTRLWNAKLMNIPAFADAVKAAFMAMLPNLHSAISYLEKSYDMLKETGAITRNAALWSFYDETITEAWLDAELERLKNWWKARLFWLIRRCYDIIPAKAIN